MIAYPGGAWKTFGAWDGTLYLFGRALEKISGKSCFVRKYYIVAQPVPSNASFSPDAQSAIKVRLLTAEEVFRLVSRPPHVLRRRIDTGSICFGAFIGERLVGFQWVCLGPYEEDDVRTQFVPLPERAAAWDYDIFVDPDYRLGRTFVRLWQATNRYLAERGVRWTSSRISAFAPDSRRSHASMGAMVIAKATYLMIGRMQVAVFTRPPYLHVGFSTQRRPVLRVLVPEAASAPAVSARLRSDGKP